MSMITRSNTFFDQIQHLFNIQNFDQVRQLTLKIMLSITAAISSIMIPLNLFVSHNYSLIFVDIFLSVLSLTLLYQIFKGGDYLRASYVGLFILFVGFISIVYTEKGINYSLVWSYFFSPFAIITLGANRGIKVTLFYLSIIFALTYSGIGSWLDGDWNSISFLRFVLAHLAMMLIIYTTVKSNEKAYATIEQLREEEENQKKEFERLSITDHLTSLYNRRFLQKIFQKELIGARVRGQKFAFFLLDIDNFKAFNDTYGHHAGDHVLEHIANFFHEYIKYGFRIGGDEFAGIVTGADEETIKKDIENFYQATCFSDLPYEDISKEKLAMVTCSMGVFIDDGKEIDYKEFFKKADQALYEAKKMGRNRIVYL